MSNECQRCGRPVQDATICNLCTHDLERALGDIPALTEELDTTLSRQAKFSQANDGGKGADTPVVFHEAASDIYWELRNKLIGWTKLHAEETAAKNPTQGPACKHCLHITCSTIRRQRRPLPADTLTAMSRHLLGRVEWFRHHELAAEMVDDIREPVHRLAHIIDRPQWRSFPIGPCPEQEDGEDCPGEVRAFLPTDETQAPTLLCQVCGKDWPTIEWLRTGRRILDKLADA